MLKYLGIALLVLLAACRKSGDAVLTEAAVAKKMEFHVHANPQYTNPAYEGVSAEVKMAIYKINYRNGESQLLWDTTFASRPLTAYPNLPHKFLAEKTFSVLESKEKLQAAYTIRYQTPQGPAQETGSTELVPGDNFAFLDVNI